MAHQHIQPHNTGSFFKELGYQFSHLFDQDKSPHKLSYRWEKYMSRAIGFSIILLNLSLLFLFHLNHPETPFNVGRSIVIGISSILVALPFLRGIQLGWVGSSLRTYWIFLLFICYVTSIPAILFLATIILPDKVEVAEVLIYVLTGSTFCWLGATFSSYHLLRAGQEVDRTRHKASLLRTLMIIFWLACFVTGLVTLFISFRI